MNIAETNTSKSKAAFEAASKVMPGGVSSPVRAFKAVGGTPRFMARAEGASLWDVDGNEYIDLVGTWGPAIAGHAHPRVVEKLQQVVSQGTSFGTPSELETVLAEAIIKAMPNLEMVRFVNSGTEAAMSTVRLARAVTGRNKVIKFEGCYHGHVDALLVAAGSGAATLGSPNSPGVPAAVVADTLLLPYNDLDAVTTVMERDGSDIAAILVEPFAGNMGFIRPHEGFLEGLRDLATKHGSLLVFDEVMTGFRVAHGGAQEITGIKPDVTCLGKVIGGGMPVGAYGGSAEVMSQVSPSGSVYQAGTLSGNPVAMTAGIETLKIIGEDPDFYTNLHAKSEKLVRGILDAAIDAGVPLRGDYQGGMLGVFFHVGEVSNFETAQACHHGAFNAFFHGLLNRGVYPPPSSYEAMFLSAAHTDDDIDLIISAAREALVEAAKVEHPNA
jgi:glutamate-1-semialdehyde 2,1-aminomutase